MIELKPLERHHGDRINILMNENICRHLGCRPMKTMEQVLSYIYAPNSTQPIRFALHHPAIGMVGVASFGQLREPENTAVIGYWVGRPYQGNGYARMGLIKLLQLLSHFNINKVHAEVYPENKASYTLLEDLGFACDNPNQLVNEQLQYELILTPEPT